MTGHTLIHLLIKEGGVLHPIAGTPILGTFRWVIACPARARDDNAVTRNPKYVSCPECLALMPRARDASKKKKGKRKDG